MQLDTDVASVQNACVKACPSDNALVSVIIPVYNVGTYLEESLRAVLGQTYKDIEVILIEDGSTDDSWEIAQRLAKDDGRITLLKHSQNRGVGAARNTGVNASRGNYICFVDPDDMVHPQMVEILLDKLLLHDADFAHTSSYHILKGVATAIPQYIDSSSVQDELSTNVFSDHMTGKMDVFVVPWGKIFKKHVVQSVRFAEGVYSSSDMLFTVSYLSTVKTGVCVHEKLYFYRIHSDSITMSPFNVHRAMGCLRIIQELYSMFRHDPVRLSAIQVRYLNNTCKKCIASIAAFDPDRCIIKAISPEIKRLYNQRIINYKGLSLRGRWRLWRVLHLG